MGKREDLIAKILAQYATEGRPEVLPVVGVDEFFEGNTDEYSIAPNIVGYGHPGLTEFRRILTEIRSRPEVQDVLIAIHESPDADDPADAEIWPDSDTVYVLTSATSQQLADWASTLRFNEVGEGWSCGTRIKPYAAPEPEPGMRVLALWWD